MAILGDREPVLVYPLVWTYKIFAVSRDCILNSVRECVGSRYLDGLVCRESRGGKYVVSDVTVVVSSQVERDSIYISIKGCEGVVMVM